MNMITNIFTIFDPSSSISLSLNWISSLIIFLTFPYQFWLLPSRYSMLIIKLLLSIFKEYKIIIKYNFSNLIIFIRLIYLIIINNLIGLLPYIFTASSHIRFNLSLSLSIWFGILTYGLFNYFNLLMAHIIPLNTPIILIKFIVIIETIRLIIRPITLAIRLTANIIAGHILLSLLRNLNSKLNFLLVNLIILIQILLFILEISVAIIQAYVLSTLSVLYRREI